VQSPFDVLGVDPDADDEEIVRAYRRRVKEAHPDHGGSAREFQAVHEAYERIKAGRWDDRDAERDPGDGRHPRERTPRRPMTSRVEYLNYEVLDDHGWSLHDDRLFERAAAAGLGPIDHGEFTVRPDESLLEAAERRGFAWPFACRGGACANCAVALKEGELSQPVDHILPQEMLEQGIRLSCNGIPLTDELKVVYNVKNRPDLEDLRLPPGPFKWAHADD
jgi:ferredoxin